VEFRSAGAEQTAALAGEIAAVDDVVGRQRAAVAPYVVTAIGPTGG
jgi:hypothetical protein